MIYGKNSTVAFYLAVIALLLVMLPSRMLARVTEAETTKVNTEDAIPDEPGDTEVELTYSYTDADQAFDANNDRFDILGNRKHQLDLTISHGFTEQLEAAVKFGWANVRDLDSDPQSGEGFGDLDLKMKWLFLASETYGLYLAYVPGISIPLGDATTNTELGPSQNFFGFVQQVIVTAVAEKFNGSFEGGFGLPLGEHREDSRALVNVNMALGYQLTGWLQPEVELNYGKNFFDQAADEEFLAATIGAIMNLAPSARLDVGVQRVFYGENTNRSTVASMNLSVTF